MFRGIFAFCIISIYFREIFCITFSRNSRIIFSREIFSLFFCEIFALFFMKLLHIEQTKTTNLPNLQNFIILSKRIEK